MGLLEVFAALVRVIMYLRKHPKNPVRHASISPELFLMIGQYSMGKNRLFVLEIALPQISRLIF